MHEYSSGGEPRGIAQWGEKGGRGEGYPNGVGTAAGSAKRMSPATARQAVIGQPES